ncbi:hypothetical protein BC940DRAFT_86907 [Gongronella butleri]|nr:hypothetical protein BC940DRAFT_86907 [Gongronella butleri]
MNIHSARYRSFVKKPPYWPHADKDDYARTEEFVNAGFFFAPTANAKDRVQCYMCDIVLDDWRPGQSPMSRHSFESKTCPLTVLNYPGHLTPVRMDDHDHNTHPESDVMFAARLATFEKGGAWPPKERGKKVNPTAKELAEAGFVFEPTAQEPDRIFCAYCGLTIDNIHQRADPMKKHKTMRPKCAFVTRMARTARETQKRILPEAKGSRVRLGGRASRAASEDRIDDRIAVDDAVQEKDKFDSQVWDVAREKLAYTRPKLTMTVNGTPRARKNLTSNVQSSSSNNAKPQLVVYKKDSRPKSTTHGKRLLTPEMTGLVHKRRKHDITRPTLSSLSKSTANGGSNEINPRPLLINKSNKGKSRAVDAAASMTKKVMGSGNGSAASRASLPDPHQFRPSHTSFLRLPRDEDLAMMSAPAASSSSASKYGRLQSMSSATLQDAHLQSTPITSRVDNLDLFDMTLSPIRPTKFASTMMMPGRPFPAAATPSTSTNRYPHHQAICDDLSTPINPRTTNLKLPNASLQGNDIIGNQIEERFRRAIARPTSPPRKKTLPSPSPPSSHPQTQKEPAPPSLLNPATASAVKSSTKESLSVENEPAPAEKEPAPAEKEPTPMEKESAPVEKESAPAEKESAPAEKEPMPAQKQPLPAETEAVPAKAPLPTEKESLPAEKEASPAESTPIRAKNASMPSMPAQPEQQRVPFALPDDMDVDKMLSDIDNVMAETPLLTEEELNMTVEEYINHAVQIRINRLRKQAEETITKIRLMQTYKKAAFFAPKHKR